MGKMFSLINFCGQKQSNLILLKGCDIKKCNVFEKSSKGGC